MFKLAAILILLQGLHLNNCKVAKLGRNLDRLDNDSEHHPQLIQEDISIEAHSKSTNLLTYKEKLYDIPDSLDWRDKGVVGPVQNQGTVNSFNINKIVGMVDSDLAVRTGKLVGLSVQQILDCCSDCNKSGGISIIETLKYIQKFGLESETDYPSHPQSNSSCRYNSNGVVPGTKGGTFEMVERGNENDLKTKCAMAGPVFVLIDVTRSFQTYRSGVYYDRNCDPNRLDHAMLLVGYGTEGKEDYWIVKNSWGVNWGEMGYAKMSRNRNDNCGIANFAYVHQ